MLRSRERGIHIGAGGLVGYGIIGKLTQKILEKLARRALACRREDEDPLQGFRLAGRSTHGNPSSWRDLVYAD